MTVNRRDWLKQSSLAALGLGLSLRSLGNEEGLPRQFGSGMGIINLGSNENPYGISPLSKKAITDMLGEANRYSFNIGSLKDFKNEIARYFKLSPDQLLITAGSGEGLNLLARHYSGGNIVAGDPTFAILPNTAKKTGSQVIEVPLTNEKVHDTAAMLNAINDKTRLVYVCNPANPTTTILKPDQMRNFCEEVSKKTIVAIDEAYIDYVEPPDNESMLVLIDKNPKIIILRTFSKIHAMAGLRLGFIAAHPDLIQELSKNYFSNTQFCTSVLTQTAVLASMKDEEHRKQSREKNAAVRKYTSDALSGMNYHTAVSQTNFLFFQLKNYTGDFAKEMLEKNKILVRSNIYRDGNWCRVSLGTMEEMQQFLKIVKEMKA